MTEHDDQVAVINWVRWNQKRCPELTVLYAIPNGAKLPYKRVGKNETYSRQGQYLVAEGLLPGACDLCLPVARHGYFGLYIEMKHGKNGLSQDQIEFMDMVNYQGYLAVVCRGDQEAIDKLCWYLGYER